MTATIDLKDPNWQGTFPRVLVLPSKETISIFLRYCHCGPKDRVGITGGVCSSCGGAIRKPKQK